MLSSLLTVSFLNMYLLPFLASPFIFIFLFSYPHFLGDRSSIKFQQESRRKLQNKLRFLFEKLLRTQTSWRQFAELLRSERYKRMYACNFGSSLPKEACKSDKFRQELSDEYLAIYLPDRLQYSRERAI